MAMNAFKDLRPFTIVINKSDDAMFLSLALMNYITGDIDLTNDALKLMISHARLVGVETAVEGFFRQATEEEVSYPEFLKPVLIVMFNHMFENKDRIYELVKNAKEKE